MNTSFSLNETVGFSEIMSCNSCNFPTIHEVVCSYDVMSESRDSDSDYFEAENFQVIQCRGCMQISFLERETNSDEIVLDDYGENIFNYTISRYPSEKIVQSGLGKSGIEVVYLPKYINNVYQETIEALNSKLAVLSAIGLRALIEAVCIEKTPSMKNLAKGIDELVECQLLTKSGAESLHKLRTIGNKAAHEIQIHSIKELLFAFELVEHILKEVFILPAKSKGVGLGEQASEFLGIDDE